jgi:hypothetical protein
MKNEIIYTDDYALIVSDEHITDVRPHKGKYHLEDGLTINKFPDYLTDLGACKLIIAHRPLGDAPILGGVPLLTEFSKEDDVAELALRTYPFGNSERNALITGYNKAKETYKYTEDDLTAVWNIAFNEGMSLDDEINDPVSFKDVIKSLQQPKRPKYFECEMEPKYKHIGAVKGIYGSGFRKQNLMYGLPKTITNPQGQTELVGSYTY